MVPREVGSAWEVITPAKLNLYLEVLGKRTDGFHELETLMVPVGIYDQLFWTEGSHQPESTGCSLSIADFSGTQSQIPRDEGNLVLRAANLIAARAGVHPYGQFHLVKRIPPQAGMGGGSSDAAATLLLANKAWQLGLGLQELTNIAAELGSDVPFFLNFGPAICRGRGEIVEPVPDLPRLNYVIVRPEFGLSTPRVFRELNEIRPVSYLNVSNSAAKVERLLEALRSGAIGRACGWMANSLEEAAVRLSPRIRLVSDALARAGCWGQLMTGSGSAVVGIARTATQAQRIARVLSAQKHGTVLAAASGW